MPTPYASRHHAMIATVAVVIALSAAMLTHAATGKTLPATASFERISLAPDQDRTTSLAWGDVDADGDLDLAVGNLGVWGDAPSKLYKNLVRETGELRFASAWGDEPGHATRSLAWADMDGDGDLDLALGNDGGRILVYRNEQGALTTAPIWQSSAVDPTMSIAWGDVNGDGKYDLAVGNWGTSNKVYMNTGNELEKIASWQSVEADHTRSLAWGDVDKDGDLDLIVGNSCTGASCEQNRLYLNKDGELEKKASWETQEHEHTVSVAWGDVDNDGDLDLAVGNGCVPETNTCYPNRLYRNEAGALHLASWSDEQKGATQVVWGDADGDGDLDLMTGNSEGPNCLYENARGQLATLGDCSFGNHDTLALAWGDADADGDLDLAEGNSPVAGSGGGTALYVNLDARLQGSDEFWIVDAQMRNSQAITWGDVDGDGDLDLAVGNTDAFNALYLNEQGKLQGDAIPISPITSATTSLAWGDVDGDGDLDLAVGNSFNQANQVFRNESGRLLSVPVWTSIEKGSTRDVAWGDSDEDGDLDLAVAYDGDKNRLYRNDGGVLTRSASWLSRESDRSTSLAWGDVDLDGDLDLAVSNEIDPTTNTGPNRLYLNRNGLLQPVAVWNSFEHDRSTALAWGDVDGDGYPDLAVGNDQQPNRVYKNMAGHLQTGPAWWSSLEADSTTSIAWADYDGDGDLDLAAGNGCLFFDPEHPTCQPDKIYSNLGGELQRAGVQVSNIMSYTIALNWGDMNGDGRPDLAAAHSRGANVVYISQRRPFGILPGDVPSLAVATTGGALPGQVVIPNARADSYATHEIIESSIIAIPYRITDPGHVIGAIKGFFSLDGGANWQPACETSPPQEQGLTHSLKIPLVMKGFDNSQPVATQAIFYWDVFDRRSFAPERTSACHGLFGHSDHVVFRLEAYPDLHPRANNLPGPYQWSLISAQSLPFRVRGTQVRVLAGSAPVSNALVYRLPKDQLRYGPVIADGQGQPYHTNTQGFLQGRQPLTIGDRLVALKQLDQTQSVTFTTAYTLYSTSAQPTLAGLDAHTVSSPGIQSLDMTAGASLLLLNLDVSLEWDARGDGDFLAQLEFYLERTSEILYDWSNGQLALGEITIYQDREEWDKADIRIYAREGLRPSGMQGGIVRSPLTDPTSPGVVYEPGQVRMGTTWTRYGEAAGSVSDDWPRALAHELGHYALFLDDNYMGIDETGMVIPLDTCPGAMADPYREDDAAGYGEFHPPGAAWRSHCQATFSQRLTGRSDWETVTTFWPWLQYRGANAGPFSLPLGVTRVKIDTPNAINDTLDFPLFLITRDNGTLYQSSQSARAILFRQNRAYVIDYGQPNDDQIFARGARPGDRLCLFDLLQANSGCKQIQPIANEDRLLTLASTADWQPDLVVTPLNAHTLAITITNIATGTLEVTFYPANGSALSSAPLQPTASPAGGIIYSTLLSLTRPTAQGYLHITWTNGEKVLEMISDVTLGGDAILFQERGARVRDSYAPVTSTNADVLLLTPEEASFGPGEIYALQVATRVPEAPTWATVVGSSYWLTASPAAPDLSQTSISFRYRGRDIAPADEKWLKIYFWDGSSWRSLPTQLNEELNFASAKTPGPGLYALMSIVEIPLSGPGWNLFVYPIGEARRVTEALFSIAGYYTTTYGYDQDDAWDPWKMYDVNVPSWVNDLVDLQPSEPYWVNVAQDIVLLIKGAGVHTQNIDTVIFPPPATYYGVLHLAYGHNLAPGQLIEAWIAGRLCGLGKVIEVGGEPVYSININADGPGTSRGCGSPDSPIEFRIGNQILTPPATWDNSRVSELDLSYETRASPQSSVRTPAQSAPSPIERWR